MKKILLIAAITLGTFAMVSGAQANIVSYNLNFEFSGGDDPEGPPPWMTVSFNDFGGSGSVLLTISTNGLVEEEIADDVYLNFDPTLDLNELVFTPTLGNTAVENSISVGVDAFQADGDGKFDIVLDYPPPPGQVADLLGAGETISYTITSSEAIVADSFAFFSAPGGGNGSFHVAAHIQRIDSTAGENEGSGWIGDTGEPPPPEIPEPMTMLLFGTGLVGLAGARRRQNKQ